MIVSKLLGVIDDPMIPLPIIMVLKANMKTSQLLPLSLILDRP